MAGRTAGAHRLLGGIRGRLVATVLVLLFASSLTSTLLLRQVLFDRLDREIVANLRRETDELLLLTGGTDPVTGVPFDEDAGAVFDVYFSREVPDEGESLLAFVDGSLYRSARARDAAEAGELEGAIDHWLTLSSPEEGTISTSLGDARYSAVPVGEQGTGLFVAANFPAFERGEIDDAIRAQVRTQLIGLAVASVLALALAGRVLRPLRSLARTARTISDTDLTQRIPVRGRDEASQIAMAFNDMVGRLERAFTRQRQFVDDTAHELRTPLTVVRGHIELLEPHTDPPEHRATVTLVTDEVDRMHRIVSDLVLLVHAEHPDFLRVEPLPLQDLLVSTHRKVSALGPRDWRLDAPAVQATIVGDGQRLTQAVIQLADNAFRHTDEGATITVGGAVDGGTARLWVDDTGAGVPPEDAERIFERFERGSGRREGAGLGLAIVTAIAEAHGGTARLVPRPGPGARFELVIPSGGHRPPARSQPGVTVPVPDTAGNPEGLRPSRR